MLSLLDYSTMYISFDLSKYEFNIDSESKELTLYPKQLTKIPVLCGPSYGLPGIIGPTFEIDIHDLIKSTVENAQLQASQGFR